MKYKKTFKGQVIEICRELRWAFYVNEYRMDIDFMAEDDSKNENEKTAASIPINARYLTFRVKIFPVLQEIWEEDKDRFTEVLIHEFSHLLTEPIYEIAVNSISNKESEFLEDVRERQTQRISNIIYPLLKKKLIIKPKKNGSKPNKRRRSAPKRAANRRK
jgi:hypothetical protein